MIRFLVSLPNPNVAGLVLDDLAILSNIKQALGPSRGHKKRSHRIVVDSKKKPTKIMVIWERHFFLKIFMAFLDSLLVTPKKNLPGIKKAPAPGSPTDGNRSVLWLDLLPCRLVKQMEAAVEWLQPPPGFH